MKIPHSLLILVLALTAWSLQAAGPSVERIGIVVGDMDRSLDFYTRVLDFQKEADREFHDEARDQRDGFFAARIREVDLRLGTEKVRLTEYLNYPGRPIPLDSHGNDGWFQHIALVVSDMDAAYARLRKYGVKPISVEPQRLPDSNPAAGGIRAFYFRDPDNHALELIWFPKDKGDPRWQKSKAPLFQGIDHTAIVVKKTEQSLKFYRDKIGFRVAGESHNSGMEQAYLNREPGATLHITGLRGSSGPGIEFLEYLSPRNGRPMPTDTRPNDLWHWTIDLRVEAGTKSGPVSDPNGHALLLLP